MMAGQHGRRPNTHARTASVAAFATTLAGVVATGVSLGLIGAYLLWRLVA